MRPQKLIVLMIVLAVFSAGSAFAASCGANAPGWNCTTKVTLSGNTTTCKATATSPGGAYNISMFGNGTGGKALHVGSTYYGTASTNFCVASSCSVTFTYTGSARPTLCNWGFSFF